MTIKEFLKSKTKSIEFELICPDKIMTGVEEAGGSVDGDTIQTNGWQLDYWIKAKYKKQYLLLSGSAWYGTGKIEKVDEEEYEGLFDD